MQADHADNFAIKQRQMVALFGSRRLALKPTRNAWWSNSPVLARKSTRKPRRCRTAWPGKLTSRHGVSPSDGLASAACHRLAQAAVIIERMAILWSIAAARASRALISLAFSRPRFSSAGAGSLAKPVSKWAAAPIDTRPRLRQMGA